MQKVLIITGHTVNLGLLHFVDLSNRAGLLKTLVSDTSILSEAMLVFRCSTRYALPSYKKEKKPL